MSARELDARERARGAWDDWTPEDVQAELRAMRLLADMRAFEAPEELTGAQILALLHDDLVPR